MMFSGRHFHDYIVYLTLPFCEVSVNSIHHNLLGTYLGKIKEEVVVICEIKSDEFDTDEYPQYVKTIFMSDEKGVRYFAIFKPLPQFSDLMKAMYEDDFDMTTSEVYQVINYSGLMFNVKQANGKLGQDMLILALCKHDLAYRELYNNIKDFHDEGECPVREIGEKLWESDIPLIVILSRHYFNNLNISEWNKNLVYQQ